MTVRMEDQQAAAAYAARRAALKAAHAAERRPAAPVAAAPAPVALAARPAPRAKTPAEQLTAARRWAAFWQQRYDYAVAGYKRHYGLTEAAAIKAVMRDLPSLVAGLDAARTTLRRLGG